MVLTIPPQDTSLFPQDINNTIAVLTSVIDFLSMTLDQTGTGDANQVGWHVITMIKGRG